MNWLQKISGMSFIGTCINCLDDSSFNDSTGIYDATELAQVVEGGEEINVKDFLRLCNDERSFKASQNPDRYHFFLNKHQNIAWIYDSHDDIHYFYGSL